MYQISLPEEEETMLGMAVEFIDITSTIIDIFRSNLPFISAEDSRLNV